MKPAAFRYERPRFVEETVALLAAHGPEAKVLAGGQSLMPLLNMRLVRPRILVDIMGIVGLDSMRVEDGHLAIGAAVRDRDVELWPEARARCPMLTEALRWVGHVEIRNRGTVCGSLAHADPAAELPVVAVALDATLIATSARGARAIPAADFFRALMTTALAEDELLTEVRVPAPAPGTGWAFVEFARRQGDFALDRAVSVRGVPDRRLALRDVATVAYFRTPALPPGMERGLEATRFFEGPAMTWVNGAHLAVVEVDPRGS